VVFLFPGIGDHYVGMGHGLYESWEVFRQEIDRCAQILHPYLGIDIRKIIYPDGQGWKSEGNRRGIDLKKMLGRNTDAPKDDHATDLNKTLLAQPALFTVEYALARLWQSFGITPAAIVGHSMGEYVAACLAGVLSLEDALRLIATRARLVNDLPKGAMLAVTLSEKEVLPLLTGDLSISLINGPALCVVAGPTAAVAEFERLLNEKQIISRRVQNAHAFHSRMLSPIVSALENEVRNVQLNEPGIPYISNVTGRWITGRDAISPSYWAMHADHTSRFNDALEELWRLKSPILLEAGPGRTLGVLAMQHPGRQSVADPVTISSIRPHYENQSDVEFLLHGVGRLWLSGVGVAWESIYPGQGRRRISLPTYPFERRDYWIETTPASANIAQEQKSVAATSSLDDWFYTPSWKRTNFPSDIADASHPAFWLIMADRYGGGSRLKSKLEALGMSVALVRFGETSVRHADGSFELNPAGIEGYRELLLELELRTSGAPINIVHLGSLTREDEEAAQAGPANQNFGFFSLLHIAQAIGELRTSIPTKIGIISNRLHSVTGEEDIAPAMATVLGPCGVIPREYPNLKCFNIDLPDSQPFESLRDEWLARIISEYAEDHASRVIAYRGKYRWERRFERVKLNEPLPSRTPSAGPVIRRLRPGGVYLITGGTGGLGLAIAGYLAKACRARLVLTKKSPFPKKSSWPELVSAADTPAPVLKTLTALMEIERMGAEIEVVVADVSDRTQMQTAVDDLFTRYGTINGVIHAAGVVQAGMMQSKTRESADAVLAPKVYGTMILFDLLKRINLDFMVLFSSISSVLTPFSLSDYAAANSFLDAFAFFANAKGYFHALSINWSSWREVGMLAELETLQGVEGWKQGALESAITTKDGLEVFRRALNSNLTQVIVSPQHLDHLLSASEETFDPTKYLAQVQPQDRASRPPARQQHKADQATSTVQAALLKIWSSVFGFERIGIDDKFIDLGGHSLLAMQIVSRIRSLYQIPFTLRDFFEGSTIGQLSSVIEARILAEIEGLSDEQVRRLISNN
jgi:acyl transferase domain-containing protein